MVGIVLGAALLAYQRNRQEIPLTELHKDTVLALIAASIWGLGYFILNSVVDDVSWQVIAVFTEMTMFCLAFIFLLAVRRSHTLRAIKQVSSDKLILIASVLGGVGFMSFYIGSDYAKSLVIPTVVSSCGTLIAAALGAMFDHEKLGTAKRAGAVLVVAGVIILNLA